MNFLTLETMQNHRNNTQNISHAEISRLSFMNWEKDGCPPGRDVEYWLEAESQMKATWHLIEQECSQRTATASRPGKCRVVVTVKKAMRKKDAR